MIVNGHGKGSLGKILADHVSIKFPPYFRGLGHTQSQPLTLCRVPLCFLVQDPLADLNAAVADINPRTRHKFADLGMALPAERAHREITGPGHIAGLYSAIRRNPSTSPEGF